METKYIVKIITDFLLLFVVALPILLFYVVGQPYKRGFTCDDESLAYPYKDSTISTTVLYCIGTFLPISSMFILEWFRVKRGTVGKRIVICNRDINSYFWALYGTIGTFLFGCACSQLLTDIAKYSVGRLRPHFISVCKPDWSQINCTHVYIDPIPCTADLDSHRMKEARLSFPSGHASFSAFTMIYFVIYLQERFQFTFSLPKLVKPTLQFICLAMTFYTTLSRISDYKHHWSDVLSGFILGATVAIIISVYVSDLFCDGSQPRSHLKRHQRENAEAVALQNCSQSSSQSKLDFV